MLGGVPRILTLCAVAVVAFFAGEQLEGLLRGHGKARPALAEALPAVIDPAKSAKHALQPDQKPSLRLSTRTDVTGSGTSQVPPTASVSAIVPADAQASAKPSSGTMPAEPSVPDAASPAAAPAATHADNAPQDPKPTLQSGKDEDGQTDFVELKNLPEVSGQGEGGTARDVDVLGDQGVALPESPPDQGTADANTKSDN